ncbi:glutamate--tRNA ligase [candidate division KSB1 bacterium]|nr:MAG: glutamate--tRNA ligase [candidate division KSB1 bacterium]
MNKQEIDMSEIRVRFAPSPTGYVHVGSLRTALYNYLFARHHQGKFVLRIEDTDQSRYVEGAVENLLETLHWAGLDYDEGPEKDGPYGPYFQSQRKEIYKRHVQELLDKDAAYPCFCSEETLTAMREEQQKKGLPVMYDGRCRNIPKEQALQRMKSEPHVIRLKVPRSGNTVVHDIIRGDVSFENALIDDQVLLKSDGFPTYHLANVVDDHLMKISHVIRGEEWLPSTPKHILLYQAFGWEPPQFAHLPLLLNPDRTKLSKRQGDVAVEDYRAKGFLPQALINFVALLGWNKGDDQEIFSLEELVKYFSLERVNKAGAVFDVHKLEWMNGHYIRSISEEEYLNMGMEWLRKLNLDTDDAEKNKLILQAVRPGLNKFADLPQKTAVFFKDALEYDEQAKEWLTKPESKEILKVMIEELSKSNELTVESFSALMKTVQKRTGQKGKNLWMPVRAAITGETHGPDLGIVLTVIGKQKVEQFLKQALAL